jgi:beta-galactosidase
MREESLTFITFDSYPDFAYSLDGYQKDDPFKDRWSSKKLAETRAISSVYGIMEQQSGANGWTGRMEAPSPKPGQITLWTMQSIANGADYVSYFRWRTSTMGTEIYWHGILDYSGRDNRRLKEITRIHENTEKLQDIAGAEYAAKIGILKDYDNEWDTYYDKWHARVESVSQDALFMGLQQIHAPFNYVYLTEKVTAEDLQCYELLFYPHPVILTKERMEVLEAYVANGGRLVMACRTGYKSEDGRCVMDKLPGLASKVTGTDIPEYSFVSPEDGHVYADWDGEKIEAAVFNDLLAPTGEGQVLARYQDTYYAGEAALIRNSFGKGEAYYFGGAFTPETVKVFAEKLGVAEPWREYITLPESCELAVRKKGDRYFMFVLNYPAEEAEIIFHKPVRDMLDGTYKEGRVVLSAYEARVFEF